MENFSKELDEKILKINLIDYDCEFNERNQTPVFKSETFEEKFSLLKKSPFSSIVLIADYDNTFTREKTNGKPTPSSFRVIHCSRILPDDFVQRSKERSNYYSSFERNLGVDFGKRDKLVKEWYTGGLNSICELHLTKQQFQGLMDCSLSNQDIYFRNGTLHLFELVDKFQVPLVLVSAGIKIIIELELKYLLKEKYDKLIKRNLLHIIGNEFIYNDKGQTDQVLNPIIYTFNKSQFVSKQINILNKEELNVIFFGDHLNDISCLNELQIKNIVSVGFANCEEDKVPKEFFTTYDAVIKNDGDFWFINGLIEEIAKENYHF